FEVEKDESWQLGHTVIKGVDIWDGHLAISSQDVSITGRGLSLEFTRTYSSAGSISQGPLGAGWTDNYNVRLFFDDCGNITVVGGEGAGNTFSDNGLPNNDMATLFGLPSGALFYEPQAGFHSTLVKPDPSKNAYDFYTKTHVRYHFESEPDLAPYNKAY